MKIAVPGLNIPMKLAAGILNVGRPWFNKGGRLAWFHPVFAAIDNLFFASMESTPGAPFTRDPLDLKRYMTMVIIALAPSLAAAIYFFGWRVLAMLIVSYVAGGTVEVIFAMVRKEEIAEGFLVTGFIFPLILPPNTPLWAVAVGIIFGVLIGKEVFGGTGRNLFNAALVGRCFLAFGYPSIMAGSWLPPPEGILGRLVSPFSLGTMDTVTTATPLVLAKGGEMTSTLKLLFGAVSGSAGETSAVAIVGGGVFLLATGVANWRTVLSILGAFSLLSVAIATGHPGSVPPLSFSLLSGGLLFGAFFMATDPVTSPITQAGKYVYGALIGAVTLIIRNFSGYVEGVTFAILLGNICAPLIDEVVLRFKVRRLAHA